MQAILILLLIIGGWIFLSQGKEKEVISEYKPEEEISDEQLRQTIVSLYFQSEPVSLTSASLI